MNTKKTGIIAFLLIGSLSLSSCRKEVHHRFTEEEANFLPYKLGDSISISYARQNELLYVSSYEKHEVSSGFGNDYYDFLVVEAATMSRNKSFSWNQDKYENAFQFDLGIWIDEQYRRFRYTHNSNDLIIQHNNLVINNEAYSDVIELIDTASNSNIFLNSKKGIILLETDLENYYFELLNE